MTHKEFIEKYKEIINLPPKKAIKEFKSILAVEQEPSEINMYCVVGIMYYMLETTDNQKILKFMKKPLMNLNKYPDIKPKCSFLLLVGLIYTDEEQHDLSRFYYSLAVKLAYKLKEYALYASTINNIAISYANEEKYQLALEQIIECEKYINYLPDDAKTRVRLNKVICLFNLKKYDEALDLYKTLADDSFIKDDNIYSTYLYTGIELYDHFKNKEVLEKYYKEVIDNIESFPIIESLNIGTHLADYAFENKNMGLALKLKDKVLDFIKNNPENYKVQLQFQRARYKFAEYTKNEELQKECLINQIDCYEHILDQNSKNYLKQVEQTHAIEKLRMKYQTEKTENKKLKELSYNDSLTGVDNKRSLLKLLKEKTNYTSATIGILDVDYFKHINDTYSHQEGDLVLKKLGQIMLGYKSNYNIDFYRFGGDEFVFVIKNQKEKTALELINSFHKNTKHITFGNNELLSSTIGIIYREENINLQEMLDEADQLLYEGKKKYGKGIVIHK